MPFLGFHYRIVDLLVGDVEIALCHSEGRVAGYLLKDRCGKVRRQFSEASMAVAVENQCFAILLSDACSLAETGKPLGKRVDLPLLAVQVGKHQFVLTALRQAVAQQTLYDGDHRNDARLRLLGRGARLRLPGRNDPAMCLPVDHRPARAIASLDPGKSLL